MNVLVIGAGHMGSGIAAAALVAGHTVTLLDTSEDVAKRGHDLAVERARRLHAAPPGGIQVGSWKEPQPATLVIEAVVEDLDVKADILRRAGGLVGPDTTFATNTSSLRVADVARASGLEDRLLGLHFFSPAHSSALVEVVDHSNLRAGLAGEASSWVKSLGKTPIVVPDTPGFVVNRVARPLYLQAEWQVAHGARAEDVDAELRAWGLPVGPLEIVDRTGLEVHATVSQKLHDQLGFDRFQPVPVVQELIDNGRLGARSGRGFLTYLDGRRVDTDDVPGTFAAETGGKGFQVLAHYVNEAALVVDDGSVPAQVVDEALKLALGHPVGPFGWLPRLGGTSRVIDALHGAASDSLSSREPLIAESLRSGKVDIHVG